MTKKRLFISTGEVSGDLQGALLIDALKRQAEVIGVELEIVALGGSRMAKAGATLLDDTTAIGSMGLVESLPFVLPTLKIQRRAKQYLRQNLPDVVVLIDYMGPNLSIGSFMQHQLPQVPVVFYIAPQDWVWSASSLVPRDTMTIVEMTDKLLAVFPEEARYFEKKGASVSWVGHPLVDRMESSPTREEARRALGIGMGEKAIALVPASRRQELKYLMPIVFEAAKQIQLKLLDNQQTPLFWIPLSLEVYRPTIEVAIEQYGLNAKLIAGQTQEVLAAADLAIAKSGTVNLELALLNVPQVVLYRVSKFTYWIGQLLKFSIPFMSPPNLVVMREIVPELLQEKATAENIVQESMELLLNPQRREQTLKDYQEMRQLLGEVGVCDRAAKEILEVGL
ncbi:MAG TPA: lipid-A-disaccharide synthase [Candidatus Sericytochromatia bacterium]